VSSYSHPKGTYDVYPGGQEPHESPELWAFVEEQARDFFRRYNYSEVRTPVFEEAQLFVRSVGEASDIVRKEMFVFEDKGGAEAGGDRGRGASLRRARALQARPAAEALLRGPDVSL
jgi:histidyl-tRNA synthetase